MTENLDLLLGALALVLAYYVALPLLVGRRQRYPAAPVLQELDLEQLDPALAKFLMTRTRALFALGFDEPTLVQKTNQATNVSMYLIMLVNRRTGDKAMVTVMVTLGPAHLQTLYVEFSTRFESGEVFDTHNSQTLPAFPPDPLAVRTQVPSVSDLRELFRLHTFVMSKHDLRAKRVLYEPGQALDYLVRFAFVKSYEEQVKRGWMYYDPASDCYRLTLKGAYRVVWGLLQPWKALRTKALYHRARAILEEFHQARAAEDAVGPDDRG